MMTVRLQPELAMARAVVSKNKFRQIVALNFQENHASQDIQRSMHNDDHEILFVRDCTTQCPRMDLNKKSLPRPKTTTA